MDKERIDVNFEERRALQQVLGTGGAGGSRTMNRVHAREEQNQRSRAGLPWESEGKIQLGQSTLV